MKAVILSAGQGRRLMPLTENLPKCCLVIEGKTVLQHQAEALVANGVDDILVVTGFGHRVVDEIVQGIQGLPIRTLYNPFYALSDNLGTCWLARKEMQSPFLLLNGDTLFEPSTLEQLLSGERYFPVTLATDSKQCYDEDDMKIHASRDRLERVGKQLHPGIVNGESIGMMVFDQLGADAFVRRVERMMTAPDGLARWYLSAIDELAMAGLVGIRSIEGSGWCEVDDLHDFGRAEELVRGWQEPAKQWTEQDQITIAPA